MDPNGHQKKNNAELKEEIIKLRRLEEEEHGSQNRMEGVAPHRVVAGGVGGIVDPPVGGGGGDNEQIDSLSQQLANNFTVGTAGENENTNLIVNRAADRSRTVNINCNNSIIVNQGPSLTESKVKELVEEEVRKWHGA